MILVDKIFNYQNKDLNKRIQVWLGQYMKRINGKYQNYIKFVNFYEIL